MTKKHPGSPSENDNADNDNAENEEVEDETAKATPIAATLADLVHEFDLSNKDGRMSLQGDASYSP